MHQFLRGSLFIAVTTTGGAFKKNCETKSLQLLLLCDFTVYQSTRKALAGSDCRTPALRKISQCVFLEQRWRRRFAEGRERKSKLIMHHLICSVSVWPAPLSSVTLLPSRSLSDETLLHILLLPRPDVSSPDAAGNGGFHVNAASFIFAVLVRVNIGLVLVAQLLYHRS